MRTALPLILALSACGEPTLTAVTFNAGHAVGFVRGASTRAPVVGAALAELEADVVCLQEVWRPEDVATYEAAVDARFPHRFFPAAQPDPGEGAACTEAQLSSLLGCFRDNCSEVCIDDQASCLLSSCALPFAGLPASCGGCVQANVGRTADEVEQTCTTEATRYAYGGSFGTGILSAWPLASVEETVFDSTTNRRGALHAVVEAPGGDVDVYCTHLSADLSPIPYTGAAGSWGEENAAQIDALLAWVDASVGSGRHLLMGDFNAGPELPGIAEELPDSYDLLAASSLRSPYAAQRQPCTYCPDNPLIGGEGEGRIIDHVFVGGTEAELVAERVLDEPVDVPHCEETLEDAALSDHYGVRVIVSP